MLRTKKILALFLAVVLMFSALPFSVSADEVEMVEMDTPILLPRTRSIRSSRKWRVAPTT